MNKKILEIRLKNISYNYYNHELTNDEYQKFINIIKRIYNVDDNKLTLYNTMKYFDIFINQNT